MKTLIDRTTARFQQEFQRAPQWMAAAPGRVNLIGEHTDYNGGFVLPMAIDRYTLVAAAPREDGGTTARVFSSLYEAPEELAVAGSIEKTATPWANYVQGVIAGFVARGATVQPFDAVIDSTVPLGGGLSSSAAIEVAVATMLEQMTGIALGPVEKALLAQKAEHEYAGMPCGIMDQFSSVMGEKDRLMLIDCKSQTVELVPFEGPDVAVLIVNSNVKHELTGTEYADRRYECESTAKKLGKEWLRDVTLEDLEAAKDQLTDHEYRRARHVVSEDDRTVAAAEALKQGRFNDLAPLMYASHDSLRTDFEVSCEELDVLVDIARSLGPEHGVLGSRMTGGGFGGCTVSLVKTEALESVIAAIEKQYHEKTGIEPTAFATRPSRGAHEL